MMAPVTGRGLGVAHLTAHPCVGVASHMWSEPPVAPHRVSGRGPGGLSHTCCYKHRIPAPSRWGPSRGPGLQDAAGEGLLVSVWGQAGPGMVRALLAMSRQNGTGTLREAAGSPGLAVPPTPPLHAWGPCDHPGGWREARPLCTRVRPPPALPVVALCELSGGRSALGSPSCLGRGWRAPRLPAPSRPWTAAAGEPSGCPGPSPWGTCWPRGQWGNRGPASGAA